MTINLQYSLLRITRSTQSQQKNVIPAEPQREWVSTLHTRNIDPRCRSGSSRMTINLQYSLLRITRSTQSQQKNVIPAEPQREWVSTLHTRNIDPRCRSGSSRMTINLQYSLLRITRSTQSQQKNVIPAKPQRERESTHH